MNRFRRRKEGRDNLEGSARPSVESEISISSFSKKTFRLGKKNIEPESRSEIDLTSVLPSTDNFRTSLLMNGLSARFSMLREIDDPNSKIGKASDDSVMFSKRASKFNELSFQAHDLADIAEVSSIHKPSQITHEMRRAVSNALLPFYETSNDLHSQSIMNRSRPGEGNNLFGGRQKVNVGNRVLYEDDVGISAYQRERRLERARLCQESQDSSGNLSDQSCDELSPKKYEKSQLCKDPIPGVDRFKQTPLSSVKRTSPERRISKTCRLYELNSGNNLYRLQTSTLSNPDTNSKSPASQESPRTTTSFNAKDYLNQRDGVSAIQPFRNSPTSSTLSGVNESEPLSTPLSSLESKNAGLSHCSLNQGNLVDSMFPSSGIHYKQSDEPKQTNNISENCASSTNKSTSTELGNKSLTDKSSLYDQIKLNSFHVSKRSNSNSSIGKIPLTFCNSGSLRSHLSDISTSSKGSSQISLSNTSPLSHYQSSPNSYSCSVNDVNFNSLNFSDQPKNTRLDSAEIEESSIPQYTPNLTPSSGPNSTNSHSLESLKLSENHEDNGLLAPEIKPINEIIGMVRQHMRYESNTSSIYEAPPSVSLSDLTFDPISLGLQNDYLTQTNPWEGENESWKNIFSNDDLKLNSQDRNEGISNPSTKNCHISSYCSMDLEYNKTVEETNLHEDRDSENDALTLTSRSCDKNFSYAETADKNELSEKDLIGLHHIRNDSTDTQREKQNLKNELASRRRHVQEKLKSFVESDSLSPNPVPGPEIFKDVKSTPFGILRTKNSRGSVRPKDGNLRSMKKLGLGNVKLNNLSSPRNLSSDEDNGEGTSAVTIKTSISQGTRSFRQSRRDNQRERERQLASKHEDLSVENRSYWPETHIMDQKQHVQQVVSSFQSAREESRNEKDRNPLISNFSTNDNEDSQYSAGKISVKLSDQDQLISEGNLPLTILRNLRDNSEEIISSTNQSCPEISTFREPSGTCSNTSSNSSRLYGNSPSSSIYVENEITKNQTQSRIFSSPTPHLIHYTSSPVINEPNGLRNSGSSTTKAASCSTQNLGSNYPTGNSYSSCAINNKRLPPIPSAIPRWQNALSRFHTTHKRKSDENTRTATPPRAESERRMFEVPRRNELDLNKKGIGFPSDKQKFF